MRRIIWLLFFLVSFCYCGRSVAQQRAKPGNLVYVDKQGVLRFNKDNTEASFFGVNYTAPFAYSYRALNALHVDIEKEIREDVYHFARLGLDAFRVHVWDTEISDTAGNLIDNEHLKLFDFLLNELKKRNIRVIITPIAFWGNGYPQKDEDTPGFSRKYGKAKVTSNDTAIIAQENYLHQFFKHANPYTRETYGDDQNIIAVELNNEPSHTGLKSSVTNYINRLAAAVRATGFTKPLYYNISQSPYYADAVAQANVNGFSFQWYPSGLVANHEVQGNFLPNVDRYTIPFDTISAYRNKSKMIYEFDAADVLQSCLYPAIAKSFRNAGFQWATQFAYDPLALAYANTEYQTHYLNLAYTPSKAISLLIAAKVFHKMPRLKNYGLYPADSSFDVFRVSYKNDLSEMNTEEEFYYSNNTNSKPVNLSRLKHIAGVGSSAIVKYEGTGAYFLDKVTEGIWRLEVMPDAIHIRDPFERASPSKEVTRIEFKKEQIDIELPGFDEGFSLKGLNNGNTFSAFVSSTSFSILPGTYLLQSKIAEIKKFMPEKIGALGMDEFVAPTVFSLRPFVKHTPFKEVGANKAFIITANIVGIDSANETNVAINRSGGGFGPSTVISMTKKAAYTYVAEIPADMVRPGLLNYTIIVHKADDQYWVFPGDHTGNPFAWDNYNEDYWQTFVAAEKANLKIYDASNDKNIFIYPSFQKGFHSGYVTGEAPEQLILRLDAAALPANEIIGMETYFGDKLKGRTDTSFNAIVIKARTTAAKPVYAKLTLINKDGFSYAATFLLPATFTNITVPINEFKPDSCLLLPRPYPGFLPLWFKGSGKAEAFRLSGTEKLQLTIRPGNESNKPYGLELESIQLKKINDFDSQ
jgi:Cellulase (glycosyl hydrolase family 5)